MSSKQDDGSVYNPPSADEESRDSVPGKSERQLATADHMNPVSLCCVVFGGALV
jgi:hypothetical protein